MVERTDWEARAANLLKAELKRKGVTYSALVERLAEIGVSEKEVNIRNKLSRGKFSAAFMLACLTAAGCTTIHLDQD
ncbi:MAG: DUF6471 domain-containing protein [Rhodovibrionaceae bacterium]